MIVTNDVRYESIPVFLHYINEIAFCYFYTILNGKKSSKFELNCCPEEEFIYRSIYFSANQSIW
jgi:hypothetical protein